MVRNLCTQSGTPKQESLKEIPAIRPQVYERFILACGKSPYGKINVCFPDVLREGVTLNAFEPFLKVLFMAAAGAPRLALMTAAAEHAFCLDQTGGRCRMAAAAGDIPAPVTLVHGIPRLTLAFMTQCT